MQIRVHRFDSGTRLHLLSNTCVTLAPPVEPRRAIDCRASDCCITFIASVLIRDCSPPNLSSDTTSATPRISAPATSQVGPSVLLLSDSSPSRIISATNLAATAARGLAEHSGNEARRRIDDYPAPEVKNHRMPCGRWSYLLHRTKWGQKGGVGAANK